MAEQLCISSGTLKAHIHNIYAKADVSHRNELIKKASEYSVPEDTIVNEI
ncbi:helix-turn-helix transcriptional regulator [Breznakia pachnodae]